MTKHKFKTARVSLVDEKAFDYMDAYGDLVATFNLRYLDFANPVIKVIYQELNRKTASNKSASMSEKEAVRAFIKSCVLGWTMDDVDGKPIPYDVETAAEFFEMEDNKRIFITLMNFCQEESNFVQPKDVAGNS